jgi:hypothetical protein
MNNVNARTEGMGCRVAVHSLAFHSFAGPILRGESATLARRGAASGCASPGESGRVPRTIDRCTELTQNPIIKRARASRRKAGRRPPTFKS